ncbi:hypothetical protein SAMN05192552_10457 [Natrinema hispanicum]|uniref:Uncharacterized protein n=1 Tax=Natrinema hispanicum TaxID=392421 RepID=A0A1G6X9M9_9EURY|nr:hypothetical protein SAMN05192552_10457 [Natrinema hispanicum]
MYNLSFPCRCLSGRSPNRGAGLGRSGFRTVLRRSFERALLSRDDENLRFSNHGLSAPDNEAVSERAVGERHILERCADVPTASSTRDDTPPSPLTPAGIPVAKITPGCHTRSRIGVTATWHGQQSTSPTLWDYPSPKGLGVRRLDCKPETPTARDSSAFTRRRMSMSSSRRFRSSFSDTKRSRNRHMPTKLGSSSGNRHPRS